VFFLNLFNSLVLYNLALQMVSNIETVTKLNCFNMWQAFLTQCYVRISMHKINAFTILRGFLRNSLPAPSVSVFVLPCISVEPSCAHYQVLHPHPLIDFGVYLPLKKMPRLRVFRVQDFENDLRVSAQLYMVDRMQLKENCLLVETPKFVQWFFQHV